MKELLELYQTIKNGGATTADKKRFIELIAMPAHETVAKELLNDYVLYAETLENIKALQPERLKMIGESIILAGAESTTSIAGIRTAHRVHFLKTSWFRYAAIFMVAISIAAYYFISTTKTGAHISTTPNIAKVDMMPGSNRATLTLSNGQQVKLNNAAAETIVDGKFNIENNKGVLSYKEGDIHAVNTMSTPKGGQYQLTLSDGTKVWLNAASSITYPTAFTGKIREVTIRGEVYMEVAKNPKKPFKVNIDQAAEIEVLGTSFNINAYGDEEEISTTLLEGSVRVKEKNKRSVILHPGEQAGIISSAIKITKADIEKVMAWKNGLFNFEGAELQTVMQQLARWYDVEIVYQGEKPSRYFEGKMDRGLTLSQVVKILGETGIHFKIEKGKLIVSK